jgi:hypothetical protein
MTNTDTLSWYNSALSAVSTVYLLRVASFQDAVSAPQPWDSVIVPCFHASRELDPPGPRSQTFQRFRSKISIRASTFVSLLICPVKMRQLAAVLITAIYYLDFIHRPYVFQPQRFKGWFFPRHQVNLLCWVESVALASE